MSNEQNGIGVGLAGLGLGGLFPGGDASADASASADAFAAALQAQGQLQGQLQGQHQGQDQGQDQNQGQHQSSESHNGNYNGSENGNHNGNLSGNASLNGNLNGNANLNANANTSHTSVEVDLGLTGFEPMDNDAIDIDQIGDGSTVLATAHGDVDYSPGDDIAVDMDDILENSLNGGGNDNGFAINQVADLVDNDSARDIKLDVDGTGAITANAHGGTASTGSGIGEGGLLDLLDIGVTVAGAGAGDDASVTGATYASADATAAIDAMNQSLVQGANLQGNTVDVSVVGANNTETLTGEDAL